MAWYNKGLDYCNPKRPGRHKRILLDMQKLQQLYYDNSPINDIAVFFNCSVPTVKRHLKLLIPDKLRRYKFYYSEANPINQRIVKLYTNHHFSTIKIGEIVGLNDETVRKRLQRMNIQLRGHDYKNLETFHPGKLNHRSNKQYPITDLNEFNHKFIEYYCLMLPIYKIAELLQIDRSTVSRRIKFIKSIYYFKTRICKRCNNFFKFRVSERQKNSRVCGKCRLDYHKVVA